MPVNCCSRGPATVFATVSGEAPGYAALTVMVGGTTSGYSLTGRNGRHRAPASRMSSDSTVAEIGRWVKVRARLIAALRRRWRCPPVPPGCRG
jgi:hypothetical protein